MSDVPDLNERVEPPAGDIGVEGELLDVGVMSTTPILWALEIVRTAALVVIAIALVVIA